MFRLLRFLIYLGALGGFVWFGLTVELGNRTLFGHIRNILNTHESRDLVRGTKDKMGDLVDRATDKVAKGVAKGAPTQAHTGGEGLSEDPGSAPMEEIGDKDRSALRGIIERGMEKPR